MRTKVFLKTPLAIRTENKKCYYTSLYPRLISSDCSTKRSKQIIFPVIKSMTLRPPTISLHKFADKLLCRREAKKNTFAFIMSKLELGFKVKQKYVKMSIFDFKL